MSEKKCPVCQNIIDEDALVCPVCSSSLNIASAEDESPKKADKKVKVLCAAVSALLFIVLGFFVWTNFIYANINLLTFGMNDISGTYKDTLYGMYFDFDVKKTKTEVSGKTVTYDGTLENGYTKEYIKSEIIRAYIEENSLTDKYADYLKKNDLIINDYEGFAKKEGIKQSDLEKTDSNLRLTSQGESYKSTLYWNYDKKSKSISIYDDKGSLTSTLYVKKEGLVDSRGYMSGNIGFGNSFNSTFYLRDDEYGVNETIYTYKDGNCISVVNYDNNDEAQSLAGTYRAKDGAVEITFNKQSVIYRRAGGGLAFFVYTK